MFHMEKRSRNTLIIIIIIIKHYLGARLVYILLKACDPVVSNDIMIAWSVCTHYFRKNVL